MDSRRMTKWVLRWVTPVTLLFTLVVVGLGVEIVVHLHGEHLKTQRQVWQVTSLDAQGVVDKQGRLHAHLEFTVDFADVDAHGIWIALPTTSQVQGSPNTYRVKGYEGIRASSPSGAPASLRLDEQAERLEIHIGDARRQVSGRQQYVVDYVASGVSTRAGADLTDWIVLPDGFELPVNDVDVTLEMPDVVGYMRSGTGHLRSTTQAGHDGRTITVHQDHLDRGEGLSVVGAVNSGTLNLEPEKIITHREPSTAFRPSVANAIGSVAFAMGGTAVLMRRRRAGFAHQQRHPRSVPASGRPASTHPAEVAVLRDGLAGVAAVEAAVLHAINEGFVTATDMSRHQAAPVWSLAKVPGKNPQHPVTKAVVEGLFRDQDTVTTSDLARLSFVPQLAPVRRVLGQRVQEHEWFTQDPNQTLRNRGWSGLGVMFLGCGFIVLPLLEPRLLGHVPAWPGVVLIVVGFLLILQGQKPLASTDKGLADLAALKASGHEAPPPAPPGLNKALLGCVGIAANIPGAKRGGFSSGGSGGGGFSAGGGW